MRALSFGRVRRVIEQDLGARVGRLFEDFDEEACALASLGRVHRARTRDGDDVAVKVQHPGVVEAAEADPRNLGVVAPILKRLAPQLDVAAVLAGLGERIFDVLDDEVEGQHSAASSERSAASLTSAYRTCALRACQRVRRGCAGDEIGRLRDADAQDRCQRAPVR